MAVRTRIKGSFKNKATLFTVNILSIESSFIFYYNVYTGINNLLTIIN